MLTCDDSLWSRRSQWPAPSPCERRFKRRWKRNGRVRPSCVSWSHIHTSKGGFNVLHIRPRRSALCHVCRTSRTTESRRGGVAHTRSERCRCEEPCGGGRCDLCR